VDVAGEVVAKQNRYIRRFRESNAFAPEGAVSLADIRMRPSFVFRALLRRGVIVDAGGGKYYLDQDRTDAFLERRRQIILWAAVAAVLAMVIGLALAWSKGAN
jgi:hypothetical protein